MSKFLTKSQYARTTTRPLQKTGVDSSNKILTGAIKDINPSSVLVGTVAAGFYVYTIDVYELNIYAYVLQDKEDQYKWKVDASNICAINKGTNAVKVGDTCIMISQIPHAWGDLVSIIDRGPFFEEVGGNTMTFPYGDTWGFGYTITNDGFYIWNPSIRRGSLMYTNIVEAHKDPTLYDTDVAKLYKYNHHVFFPLGGGGQTPGDTVPTVADGESITCNLGVRLDMSSPTKLIERYVSEKFESDATDPYREDVPYMIYVDCFTISISSVEQPKKDPDDPNEETVYKRECRLLSDFIHGTAWPTLYQ
jgi:hypothetical protein